MIRRGATLGLMTVALSTALLPAPAGAAGVLLRYHYTAGESVTYSITADDRETQTVGTGPAQTALLHQTYLSHYTFGAVSEGGSVALTLRTDHVVDHVTQAGKTTRRTEAASTQHFVQATDGRQYTTDLRYYGAYSNGDLGLLPGHGVAPGATWTGQLTDRSALFGPGMPCHNTLVAISRAPAPIATIQTSCAAHGNGTVSNAGKQYRVAVSDTLNGRWQFDVVAGRFLTQHLHETISEVGTVRDAKGTRRFTSRSDQTIVQSFVSLSPAPGAA